MLSTELIILNYPHITCKSEFDSSKKKSLHCSYLFFLQTLKPDKPVLIMEYWVGWFDLWGNDKHHDGKSAGSVARVLGEILEFGASFNLYMFHGLFLFCF